MGFAVFHASKGKSSGASLGAHIDRDQAQKQSFKNADPDRSALNVNFQVAGTGKKLNEAIRARITEGYKGNKEIRKDAVTHLNLIFTGTHEDMKAIEQDKEKMQKWIDRNYNFVIREFGQANNMRFTLHRDERTPHIHAVVVPLTEDGKLTAREVLGGRMAMSARQTRYGQTMAEFGLERGVIGSKAIHNSEGWYLGQQKKAQEAVLSQLPSFGAFERINPKPFLEKVTERLGIAASAKLDAELKVERQQNQISGMWKERSRLNEDNEKLMKSEKVNRDMVKVLLVNGICEKRQLDINKVMPKMKIDFHEVMIEMAEVKKSVVNEITTALQPERGQDRNRGQDQSRGR